MIQAGRGVGGGGVGRWWLGKYCVDSIIAPVSCSRRVSLYVMIHSVEACFARGF